MTPVSVNIYPMSVLALIRRIRMSRVSTSGSSLTLML
jgi:hypothetical protein